jgi:hypothetical protein
MTAKELIYYGFGQIVYSLAFSDGNVQKEERKLLEKIIDQHIIEDKNGSSLVSIIFQLLDKDHIVSSEDSFNEGIKNIKLGDNHLSHQTIEIFILILEEIAQVFPPETDEEKKIIQKFSESFNYLKN